MLQNDHALFRSMFGQVGVGMVTADPEHRLVHCNRAFCDMLGYGHDEIIGLRMADVASAPDIPHTNPEFARPTGQDACYEEWQFRRKDGSSFVGAVLCCKLPDGWLQAIVLDIAETNRREAICSTEGRKNRYFSSLEKRLRDARTAREAVRIACAAIGQELGAAFAGIGEFQPGGKHTIIDSAWSTNGELTALHGRHGHFAASRIAEHLTDGVAVVEDVLTDDRFAADEGAQLTYKAAGARSSIAVPLTREGCRAAVLFVADDTPRAWTEFEIALAQETLERLWHAVERARAEEELWLTTERFQLALKGSPVTLFYQDLDLRYTWISNPSIADAPSDVIGKLPEEVYERAEDTAATEAVKRAAIRSGRSQREEVTIHSGGVDRIYDLLVDPVLDAEGRVTGVKCAAIDITERKQTEAALRESRDRQSFLLALNDALRPLSNPAEIMAKASELLGRKLAAGQVAYFDIDHATGHASVSHDWNDGTIPAITGPHKIKDFGDFAADPNAAQAIVVGDVRADPRTCAPDTLAQYQRLSIKAFINVPLVKAGRFEASLSVHMCSPRAWTQDEVALVREVAERTWDAVQRTGAEKALRESEERLRFSLKGAGAAAWQWDIVKSEQLWSPESYEFHGRDPGLGPPDYRGWLDCVHPDDRDRTEKAVFDAIEKRSPHYRSDYRVVFPFGEVRWLHALGKVDYGADGTPVRLSGINLDITERKRAEEALRESEERLRFSLKGAGAAAWQYDILTDRQIWSPESYEFHGRDPKLGPPDYKDWLDCLHPDDRARIEKVVVDVLEKKTPEYKTEYRVVLPSGEVRWLDARGKVDYGADGAPLRISGINLDISEHKRAEQALRESEEWLRLALKGSGAGAWQWDIATNGILASPESYEIHGRPDLFGKQTTYDDWFECLHPEDRSRAEKAVADAFEKKSPEYRNEYRVLFPSGEVRWVDVLGKVDYTADGVPVRVAGISLNVTERKRAEEALRENEELLRFSLKGAGAAAWQWEIPADRIVWSPESNELYEHDSDSSMPARYEPWLRSVHPADRESAEKAILEAIARKSPEYRAEYRILLPSGDERWLDAIGKVDYAADGTPMRLSGINLDITRRKSAEIALRKAKEFHRQKSEELETILAAVPTALVIAKGADCNEMAGNGAAYDLLRVSPHVELSKSAPDEQAPKNFEVFSNGCNLLAHELPMQRAAAERRTIFGQELEIRFDEGDAKFILCNALPLYDDMGEVRGAVGAFADITNLKRTEAALRESEQRLKFALDAAGAGTWEVTLETGELVASDRALSFLGIAPGTQISHEIALACVHPDDRSRLEGALQYTLDTGVPFRLEWRVSIADGSVRWMEARGERRSVSEKQVVAGLVLDITERKRAEEALRESEKRLQFALEAAGAGNWEVALPTGELAASDRTLQLLGIPPGTPATYEETLAAVHREDRPRIEAALHHTLETGEPYRLEWRVPLQDGSIQWRESRAERRSTDGKQTVAGLVLDITERKRAEEALRESEELLRCIIEHAPVPIMLSREDRKILLINPALTALTGYTPADIPTRDEWESLAYRENARDVRETLRIALESNTALDRPEILVYTKLGEKRVWSVRTAPAGRDASGQRMLVSVALDITERRRSAEEAHASRSKLEAALAAMTEAVFICDTEGRFIHFNDAFAKFHKFKSKDDCAKTFNEYPAFLDFFWPGGDRMRCEEWPAQRALRGESGMLFEYIIKRRGGETYVGSYNFAPIRDESGEVTAAVITARDVTDQKRAENRLRESEARLSSIIDTAADSIIVLDEKGIIQSANPATLGTLGYSSEELVGQHIGVLMSPDVKAKHDGYLASFVGRDILREVEARCKNGSTIPLDVAVAEWRDGEGRRFFTGILRDLSERKYNEEVLANARRLEAVGQLAGGVAHDFNNLLAVIAGNLELAEDRIADDKTCDLIRRALDAAEKGSGLNRRLLSLARKRMLKPQRLTLNSRVEETAKLLTSILGEHVAVSTNLASDPWVTVADPGEIDSAILNVAANARDAMPNGGRITIATSNVTLDAETAAGLHREARPGDYVCLAIADNGVGMPEDIRRKAMEPFFTTKGQGAGTGLGLTSVASFAKQTGGFAKVESSPGRGCAVSLYLPRSSEKLAPREAKPSEVPLGNGELILVVEDNDQVREVTLKRVESLGYAVAEARTGLEALQLLQSEDPVELVLSDIVMPGGMSGYDVARWLASSKPEIKVILCSGYNEGDLRGDAPGAIRDITVLGKPYTREQLAWALRNALAAVHRAEETSKYAPSTA